MNACICVLHTLLLHPDNHAMIALRQSTVQRKTERGIPHDFRRFLLFPDFFAINKHIAVTVHRTEQNQKGDISGSGHIEVCRIPPYTTRLALQGPVFVASHHPGPTRKCLVFVPLFRQSPVFRIMLPMPGIRKHYEFPGMFELPSHSFTVAGSHRALQLSCNRILIRQARIPHVDGKSADCMGRRKRNPRISVIAAQPACVLATTLACSKQRPVAKIAKRHPRCSGISLPHCPIDRVVPRLTVIIAGNEDRLDGVADGIPPR